MVHVVYRSKPLGGEGQVTRHRTLRSVIKRLEQLGPGRDGWSSVVRGTVPELEELGAIEMEYGGWELASPRGGFYDCEVVK